MKKYLLSTLITLISFGCASLDRKLKTRPYVSRETAYDSVKINAPGSIHDGTYFVVPVSELKRIDSTRSITYLGSEDGIHLMRIWTKVLAHEDEVYLLATSVDSCEVENPRSLKDEFEIYSAGYRPVEFSPGCFVKEYLSESERAKRINRNIKTLK